MKKLCFILFLSLIFFIKATAQEALVVPTDAQIEAIINQYNFEKLQKEYLLKDTKRKLQEMYDEKEKTDEFIKNSKTKKNKTNLQKIELENEVQKPVIIENVEKKDGI